MSRARSLLRASIYLSSRWQDEVLIIRIEDERQGKHHSTYSLLRCHQQRVFRLIIGTVDVPSARMNNKCFDLILFLALN